MREFSCSFEFTFFRARIVNFYQPGDSLTGHVDRSEKRMDLPLVSMSFGASFSVLVSSLTATKGASCIFLLGGATREDSVLPILVRSGDVSIMRFCTRFAERSL